MQQGSPASAPHPERGRGLVAGVSAYTIWGFFPLLFPLLLPAGTMEILAHRVVWSLVAVGLALVLLRRRWDWVRRSLTRGTLPFLAAAALLVWLNWLTFIWAVNAHQVVEASLGYFINPLLNIVLGLVIFGERMTRGGMIGAGLALAGVAVIAWGNAGGLWISLVLAASFGLYGTVKKRAMLPALEGLFVESALLTPWAVGIWVWLAASGESHFGTGARISGLLILAGVLTALPLWLFAIAAPRLPYGVVGVLQYLGPTLQFLIGITVFAQQVTPSYWAGLILVWAGSATYLASVFTSSPQATTPAD